MKYMPKVEIMAAISAPTGGVKKVKMTCVVVLPLSSLGIFYRTIAQ